MSALRTSNNWTVMSQAWGKFLGNFKEEPAKSHLVESPQKRVQATEGSDHFEFQARHIGANQVGNIRNYYHAHKIILKHNFWSTTAVAGQHHKTFISNP